MCNGPKKFVTVQTIRFCNGPVTEVIGDTFVDKVGGQIYDLWQIF